MKIVLNSELVRRPHMVPYPGEKLPGGGVTINYEKARQYVPTPYIAADDFPRHTSKLRKAAKIPLNAPLVHHSFDLSALDDLSWGFLGLLADCYSRHEKLRIQPQDLWYIVLNELAVEINDHPDTYRMLFTSSDENETITVHASTPDQLPGRDLVNRLATQMPELKVEWLLPRLSTHTAASETAMAAAVCHMASPYYNYMTYMCGLPEIEVTGTKEDWQELGNCCMELEQAFRPLNARLSPYFDKLQGRFKEIAQQLDGGWWPEECQRYWHSIFTTKNIGSGSELLISGWITDFYFKKRELPKLENFTSACSVVPFTNLETKREFVAVHGAFGVRRDSDGFLSCEYGQIVYETTGLSSVEPDKDEARAEAFYKNMKARNAERKAEKAVVTQDAVKPD
jgi:hypothetical protein